MNNTAVVILNYNGRDHLAQFLPVLITHTPDADLYVVDNGSTDDSKELVRNDFPAVNILTHDTNLGFCEGYNVALKQIKATYYVLLNSDVEVSPNWLGPMIEVLQNRPDVAAIQPKILSYHKKHKFEYAGAGGAFIDTLGYPFCRGRLFNHTEEDLGQYNDQLPVFWASGACLVVKASCFHMAGGLNKRFFAHMEELDLCWKLQRMGYKIYYEGSCCIYHVGGGTLHALNPKKTYLNFRNGLSLLFCHTPGLQLAWKLPLRLLLDIVAGAFFLISGKPHHAGKVLLAITHFIAQIRIELGERNAVKKSTGSFKVHLQFHGSIVWHHFVRRRKTYRDL